MEISEEEEIEAAEEAVAELQEYMGEGVANVLMFMQPLVSQLWQMKQESGPNFLQQLTILSAPEIQLGLSLMA